MSTTATLTHAYVPVEAEAAPAKPAAPRGSIWKRILGGLMDARRRQADAEIARYLALNGGHLTDETERRIAERLAGRGSLTY